MDITEDDRKNSKDDWGVSVASPDFLNNNFWKVPDAYSIDDLLREQEGL